MYKLRCLYITFQLASQVQTKLVAGIYIFGSMFHHVWGVYPIYCSMKLKNLLNHVPTVCLYSLWSSLFRSLSILFLLCKAEEQKRRIQARCLFRMKTMRKENRGPRPLIQTEDSAVHISLPLSHKYKQRCWEETLDLKMSKCELKISNLCRAASLWETVGVRALDKTKSESWCHKGNMRARDTKVMDSSKTVPAKAHTLTSP